MIDSVQPVVRGHLWLVRKQIGGDTAGNEEGLIDFPSLVFPRTIVHSANYTSSISFSRGFELTTSQAAMSSCIPSHAVTSTGERIIHFEEVIVAADLNGRSPVWPDGRGYLDVRANRCGLNVGWYSKKTHPRVPSMAPRVGPQLNWIVNRRASFVRDVASTCIKESSPRSLDINVSCLRWLRIESLTSLLSVPTFRPEPIREYRR